MADDPQVTAPTEDEGLARGGLYALIRRRLEAAAATLAEGAAALNARRKDTLAGRAVHHWRERVRTEHNCVRNIVNVRGRLVLGYNVQFALKQVVPGDVFSVHRFEEATAASTSPGRGRRRAHRGRLQRALRRSASTTSTPGCGAPARRRQAPRRLPSATGTTTSAPSAGRPAPASPSPTSTTGASGTTSTRPAMTSTGSRRPATTTSSAGTPTSPSSTRSSWRPSAGTSPSRWRTTPTTAKGSTASR